MSSPYDDNILRSLRRISRAIDLYSKQLASRHQLTGPQLVCLRALMREPQLSPSELSAQVSLSQATITGILDRLERRALVTRERSSLDKRRVLVRLTPTGRKLAESAPMPLHQRFAEKLGALPDEEQSRIDQTLSRVVAMMEAEKLDAAPMLAAGPMDAEPGGVMDFLDQKQGKS